LVHRLGEMPIQSCGQSVSARPGKLYTETGPLKAKLVSSLRWPLIVLFISNAETSQALSTRVYTRTPTHGTPYPGVSGLTQGQGLTFVHCSVQPEDLQNTSLTLELNLSTLGHIHGLYGGHGQLKLSGKGQSKLKLSGNGNQCKPLPRVHRHVELRLSDSDLQSILQGLTLVHFSAQPEPFLTQNTP